MPAIGRSDRRLLFLGGGVLLVLMAVAMLLAAGTSDHGEITTSYSSASTGGKATFLLLQSLGYDVVRWEDSPSALARPDRTTLILAEPLDAPSEQDRHAIHAFLEAGGLVIATGADGAWFLDRQVEPGIAAALDWSRVGALEPSAITRAAPEITIAKRASWIDTEPDVVPLYGDADSLSVVSLRVGRGRAMWWASATPLTNAGLREPGSVEFLLASLGPAEARQVLWDEYFHGRRRTLAAAMWQSPVKWMVAQFGLIAIVVLLTYSRRSGPVIAPAVESRLSPLEFVRTLGSLYGRASAASVAVEAADKRSRSALAKRFGADARGSADVIAAAVSRRSGRDAETLATALREADAARTMPSLTNDRALELVQHLVAETRAADTDRRAPNKEDQ